MRPLHAYGNGIHVGALLFTTCLFAPFPTLSQNSGSSRQISGTVAAPNGSPLAGAQVVLYSNSGSAEPRRRETDKAGHYSFSGLSLGAYKLSASAPAFRDSETKIVILTSANAVADLTLTPLESVKEASKADSASQVPPPTFSPAGVRGTIAPSGYSSGLSNEETAHVSATANALEPTLFHTLTAGPLLDCSQESVLLHDLENAPHDFAPNHALGTFYLSHGNYSKGIQYLGAARSLVPGDFTNSRDLAVAMMVGGRGSDAAALLEQLLLDHGSDSTLLRLQAFAYAAAGENEKSLAAFHGAFASDSTVENQFDCGLGLIQLGALRQALDLFTSATKIHSDSARLWLGLGIAQHLLDRKQEAVSALLRSADADPDFLPPLALLAELSTLSDQTSAGLRRRVASYLVAHSEDAEAHFAYALLLAKRPEENGNFQQEIASQLKRALRLNPRMARAHVLLGNLESEADNLPGAIAEFVEALKLEPGNAQAHYRLSLLYHRDGQQEAARKEMKTFLALHGKPGEEGSAGAAGAFSLNLPSTQPVPSLRACDLKPQ